MFHLPKRKLCCDIEVCVIRSYVMGDSHQQDINILGTIYVVL